MDTVPEEVLAPETAAATAESGEIQTQDLEQEPAISQLTQGSEGFQSLPAPLTQQSAQPSSDEAASTTNQPTTQAESQEATQEDEASDEESVATICMEADADLPDAVLVEADRLLDAVYGDHPHQNDGTHLTGGVAFDKLWQGHFNRLAVLPQSHYSLPNGKVGKRFIRILSEEFAGIEAREWNSERPLVYVMVILQKDDGVRRAKDIRARLLQRMNLWEEGEWALLVDDTADTMERRGGRGSRVERSEAEKARAFHAKVVSGRLRAAVRESLDGEPGGVKKPTDVCSKSGRVIVDVLRDKHPEMWNPDPNLSDPNRVAFEPYPSVPKSVGKTVTEDVVEIVAAKLGGSAGLSGTDAVDCSKWLLRFGDESKVLRGIIASMTTWLANESPSFAAYRGFVACRLLALDKLPGTRPIGIGEIWRRLMTKCLLAVTGYQATEAAGNYNLCAGLSSGIEGAIHAMQEKWCAARQTSGDEPLLDEASTSLDTQPTVARGGVRSEAAPSPATQGAATAAAAANAPGVGGDGSRAPTPMDGVSSQNDATQQSATSAQDDDPFVVLLVDADNAFNSMSRRTMLWTVRHLWPAGCRFVFNMYRHEARLIIRNGAASETILSREGVTQGDPLAMFAYGLSVVPLAKRLRIDVPKVLQPWYADDSAAQGRASEVERFFDLLTEQGREVGYKPSPDKCVVICDPADAPAAKQRLHRFNFQYKEGDRYIGGFLGSDDGRKEWLWKKIERWRRGINTLNNFATHYPQSAYAAFTRSLQSEWQYVQRVSPDCYNFFSALNKDVENFTAAILGDGDGDDLTYELARVPVRYGGGGLLCPNALVNANRNDSRSATCHLVESLLENEDLDLKAHQTMAREQRQTRRECLDERYKSIVEMKLARAPRVQKLRAKRGKLTGAWLTVAPNTDNDTLLSADEFRDCFRLRLGLKPLHMPSKCDACPDKPYTVSHALDCKKGGLVGMRHDHIRGVWTRLCRQALTRDSVKEEPFIHNSATLKAAKAKARAAHQPEPRSEERGDVSAHGFWSQGTSAIFDIRITNTECPSRRGQDPAKILAAHEKEKKDRYLDACLERRRQFTPLVFSVDGMAGAECKAAIKRLSQLLAEKWQTQYSVVCGYVRSQIQIALARSASLCIRGARAPSNRANHPMMDGGTSLRLYR